MSFVLRKIKGAAVTAGVGAVTSYFMDAEKGAARRRAALDVVRRPVAAVRSLRSGEEELGDRDPTGGALPAQVGGGAS